MSFQKFTVFIFALIIILAISPTVRSQQPGPLVHENKPAESPMVLEGPKANPPVEAPPAPAAAIATAARE